MCVCVYPVLASYETCTVGMPMMMMTMGMESMDPWILTSGSPDWLAGWLIAHCTHPSMPSISHMSAFILTVCMHTLTNRAG